MSYDEIRVLDKRTLNPCDVALFMYRCQDVIFREDVDKKSNNRKIVVSNGSVV